jgi:glycerol uptake facilitator-like aquaporin
LKTKSIDQDQKGLYGSSLEGNMVRVMTAEFLGTFFLVLAGTAVVVSAVLHAFVAGSPADSLAVALAFGLVLIALVGTFGHISGAHFNPAVTIGLALTKKFPWKYALGYIGAQFIGAIAASGVVRFVFGHAARSIARMGATYPAAGAGIVQVLVIEAIITCMLMLVIMSVATDERVSSAVVGPAIGFTLVAAVLIIASNFTGWWAYVVGPIVGAICASFMYDKFIAEAKQPQK